MSQEKKKKKSYKKLWIILGSIAALFCIMVVIGIGKLVSMSNQAIQSMAENLQTVERGDIAVETEGTGVVEPVNITAINIDYQCELETLYKTDGEPVVAGDVIAEFKPTTLDTSIQELESQLNSLDYQLQNADKSGESTIKAPVSGRVKRIFGNEGEEVAYVMEQCGGLMEIAADGKLKVEIECEAEVSVKIGDAVTVKFGEFEVSGKIESVAGKRIQVTFADGAEYNVDTEATVLNEAGDILGTGMIQSNYPVIVSGTNGTINSISVKVNDKVTAGNTVIKLKNVEYSSEYLTLLNQREAIREMIETASAYKNGYVVIAESDGIVSGLTAKEGEVLGAGTQFCQILGSDLYQVSIAIDELDIQGISAGQSATVTFDAIDEFSCDGTVSKVSLVGSNETGVATYNVTVLLSESENLLPGMTANAKISVNESKDTLLIPVDAIQIVDGEKCVSVVREDGSFESVPVTLGLVNNTYAEVLEGLNEGDTVQCVMKLEDIYSQLGINIETEE